jgi:hypothetical protein
MIQALATAVFLAVIWGAAKVMFDLFARDGAAIMAALNGRSMLAEPQLQVPPVSVRYRPEVATARRPMRAAPQLRDAA